MLYRSFGKTGWNVSAVGYGLWGVAGWTGSNDEESIDAMQLAVDLGCNFFDTALAYGEGKSEQLLGKVIRSNPDMNLYLATKVPPKNRTWPSRRGFALADVFPPDHIRRSLDTSLHNLGLPAVDLLQFHVWEDDWAEDSTWQNTVADLKKQGLIKAIGISINRWEPANAIKTIRTGLIDAVQVIYNIFDQNPEDELFPVCREHGIGVIARVPFDEGTLTGTLTVNSTWPAEDWRSTYFVPENLIPSVQRADQLKKLLPAQMTLPELALRFILANPDVATIIPGMRKPSHVEANMACGEAEPLPDKLLLELKKHRWDRTPTRWSQ